MAAVFPVDDELVETMLVGDEAGAMRRAEHLASPAENLGHLIYTSSKRALSRWVRRTAPGPDWAGASIPLNCVAPGTVATAMSAPFTATPEATARHLKIFPAPLNGIAPAEAAAEVLVWLGSEANTHLCGQVLYLDGGSDVVVRGDTVW
jgi:NAD(P)-dependent dehydrogenase (short-subunit alcohol dehydrogenase family)